MATARYQPTKAQHVYFSEARGGRNYYVRLPRNEKGVRLYERVAGGFDAAKARAHEVHGTQSGPVPVSTSTTLRDVVARWREVKAPTLKPRTVESYERILAKRILPDLGRRRVRDITAEQMLVWANGLKRQDGRGGEISTGTKLLALEVLKAMLTYAVLMQAIPAVPKLPRGSKPAAGKSRERILDRVEEDRIFGALGVRKWMAPMIDVALGQALRLGEVCGLQWGDLDFRAGTVTVRHNLGKDGLLGTPKGGREDVLPMTTRTREALREVWMKAGQPSTGPVFVNTYGEVRQQRDVQRAWCQAVGKAGLGGTGITFHALRHTGISRYANAMGMDIARAMTFARHTDAKVTSLYLHPVEDAVADEAGRAAI